MNFVEDVVANTARCAFGYTFRQYTRQRIADRPADISRNRVVG